MTALTKDMRIKGQSPGRLIGLPVKASTTLYASAMICTGTDGYAVPGADTAGLTFRGWARAGVDNSAGASGALFVEIYTKDDVLAAISDSVSQADLGKLVYLADDATVSLSSVNRIAVGRIVEVQSASRVMVRPLAAENGYDLVAIPANADAVFAAEDLVAFDGDGMAVAGADTAGLTFAGLAHLAADNTGGSDGDVSVYVRRDKYLRIVFADSFQGTAPTAAALGSAVYLYGSNKVALAATTTNDIKAGVLVEIHSTWGLIELKTFGEG